MCGRFRDRQRVPTECPNTANTRTGRATTNRPLRDVVRELITTGRRLEWMSISSLAACGCDLKSDGKLLEETTTSIVSASEMLFVHRASDSGDSILRSSDFATTIIGPGLWRHSKLQFSQAMEAYTFLRTGQHSQDPPDLLQVQGVPQAHSAQGHPVQGWQGETFSHTNSQEAGADTELLMIGLPVRPG